MCGARQTIGANKKWNHGALMMELGFCGGGKCIQVKRFTVTQEGSDSLHELFNKHTRGNMQRAISYNNTNNALIYPHFCFFKPLI